MGILLKLREKITGSGGQEKAAEERDGEMDYLIALGVLLWVVAEADDKFLPNEVEKIQDVLKGDSRIGDSQMPVVMKAIEEAAHERIDLYAFTREVRDAQDRNSLLTIVEDLFRVACADQELDNQELELIRKIGKLFGLDHKEFINAKVKVKKEFGVDTVGL